MALAAAGAAMLAFALHRRAGRGAAIVAATILSMAPYTIQLALTVDAPTMAVRMVENLFLPAVLLLLIPYLLGRRQAALE
jgi:hypothetical protein